jgi:hypothetical protein
MLTKKTTRPVQCSHRNWVTLVHADITYRLIDIDVPIATQITTHDSFEELVKKQLDLISLGGYRVCHRPGLQIRPELFRAINGAVFDSTYASPASPPSGWPQ